MKSAKPSTLESSEIAASRGKFAGASETKMRSNPHARPMPTMLPRIPRAIVSPITCPNSRDRPAPSDARIARSRSRTTARASSRFATLVHAISNSRLVAASSIHKPRVAFSVITSWSGRAVKLYLSTA